LYVSSSRVLRHRRGQGVPVPLGHCLDEPSLDAIRVAHVDPTSTFRDAFPKMLCTADMLDVESSFGGR
jgi:hypothetical protein